MERRPSLTASARGVVRMASRDEEQCFGRTKNSASGGPGICSSNGLLVLPGGAARHDGVDENEQLPGAGDQRALVHFAGGPQPLVKGDEVRIPEKGCRQRGGIERPAQPLASTFDMTSAASLTAVIIIWRKPGERGHLLAAECADLRHAHQDRERGRHSGTADAVD